METLKINLKKEIFETIKLGEITSTQFETSPFYFGKFTSNKRNTIEDVTNDAALFKTFDNVEFMCSGDVITCSNPKVSIVGDMFELTFENPFVGNVVEENVEEPVEVVDEDVVEPTVEVPETPVVEKVIEKVEDVEEVVEEIVETQEEQSVEDTTIPEPNAVGTVLIDFINNPKITVVNSHMLRIGAKGSVVGTNKRLPSRNEQTYFASLKKTTIEFSSLDELKEKLDKYVTNGFLFIAVDDMSVTDTSVTLWLKKFSLLDCVKMN